MVLLEPKHTPDLQTLCERVDRVNRRATSAAPPTLPPSQGWATRQVVEILREHGQPLAPAEIRRAIRERFAVDLKKSTITAALCVSQEAKAGRVVRIGRGRYVYAP